MPNWGLEAGTTWACIALLTAAAILLAGAIAFVAFRRRGARPDDADAEIIRREMLDECFEKGEMSREECEGRCKGFGHPGERPRIPSSAPADLAP